MKQLAKQLLALVVLNFLAQKRCWCRRLILKIHQPARVDLNRFPQQIVEAINWYHLSWSLPIPTTAHLEFLPVGSRSLAAQRLWRQQGGNTLTDIDDDDDDDDEDDDDDDDAFYNHHEYQN